MDPFKVKVQKQGDSHFVVIGAYTADGYEVSNIAIPVEQVEQLCANMIQDAWLERGVEIRQLHLLVLADHEHSLLSRIMSDCLNSTVLPADKETLDSLGAAVENSIRAGEV
jgi:ribulose kinase